MRTVGIIAALGLALVLQSALAGMSMAAAALVNLVLIVVIYVALAYGAVSGLLAGMAGGLAQDALSGGIVGVGGLSKTLVGFMVGVLGAQFIVSTAVPRFLMFIGATVAHELCFQALSALVESRPFAIHYSATLLQALVNGAVGIASFLIVERGPDMLQHRQARSGFGRRRY
jgi:rod shape-determining protein MreD